ncbi:hypothetical protein JVU11DRAFT_1084 [Chiua virens]|nr:hypothetical protein JVU11DRAFT_1084 [Chiua virens]
MGPRYMDYASPRGVHVAETFTDEDEDPYRRDFAPPPHRKNRYSHSVHQTPHIRDVTWISSPDPIGLQTPRTSSRISPAPWLSPQQAPSSPVFRPASAAPPSPAPTVGEHMAVDDIFLPPELVDPYRPQHKRSRSGTGLLKSFWHGLKKLSGHAYQPPYMSQSGSYISQTMEVPAPGMSDPSDATQYIHPTPPESDERSMAPYTSPYARRSNLGATPAVIPASLRPGSPVPSMKIPSPSSAVVHAVPPASLHASPVPSMRVVSPRGGASPIVPPGSVRMPSVASSAPAPSIDIAPPITIVSPSDSVPPSPLRNSIRSLRPVSPVAGMPRHPAVAVQEPVRPASVPPFDDGSQTLHDHMPVIPPVETQFFSAPTERIRFPEGPKATFDELLSPSGSFASTLARMRRFVDGLPWVSEEQIAHPYVPSQTPRSRLRERVRKGADPSWYNERPEEMERRAYWSEWDMWAMQSAAELWSERGRAARWGVDAGVDGPGQWPGVVYPHGYIPAQPIVIPPGYPPPGIVIE